MSLAVFFDLYLGQARQLKSRQSARSWALGTSVCCYSQCTPLQFLIQNRWRGPLWGQRRIALPSGDKRWEAPVVFTLNFIAHTADQSFIVAACLQPRQPIWLHNPKWWFLSTCTRLPPRRQLRKCCSDLPNREFSVPFSLYLYLLYSKGKGKVQTTARYVCPELPDPC